MIKRFLALTLVWLALVAPASALTQDHGGSSNRAVSASVIRVQRQGDDALTQALNQSNGKKPTGMVLALSAKTWSTLYPQLWTPLNLGPALVAWWDPTSGVALSGSNVTSWTDRSSAALVASQATTANQPTFSATGFNGFPSIIWSSANSTSLSAPGLSASSVPFTVAGIYLTAAGTGAYFGSVTTGGMEIQTGPSINIVKQTVVPIGSTTPSPAAPPAIFVASYDGTNFVIRPNGFTGTSGANSQTFVANTTLLGKNGSTVEPLNGPSGDFIKTNTVLSLSNMQKVEGYLAWKYGEQALLAAGHPYKSRPPYVSDP